MRIAVVGGTGTLGRQVGTELARRGHEVRVLSRSSPQFPIDLTSGQGLVAALEGCGAVVDASNTQRQARQVLVEGTGRLLAAEQQAGVGHHVCISIVGCDQVPMGYYRVKVDQERVVERSPVPWTVVRATQFHELVNGLFTAAAAIGCCPLRACRFSPSRPPRSPRCWPTSLRLIRAEAGSAWPDRRSAACGSWPAAGCQPLARPRCYCRSRCRAGWAGPCARGLSPPRAQT